MSRALGIDVGGTKIAAGLVDEDGTISNETIAPTPKGSSAEVLEVIAGLWERFSQMSEIEAVGISAAGLVNKEMTEVTFAPHLPWVDEPLVESVGAITNRPVVIDNDANAAAWAEHRFGSAKGFSDFIMVAVGTGIGGGIFVSGKPHRGANGMAGEIGHLKVDPAGFDCACGKKGCWEQYASGNALGRLAREYATQGEADSLISAAGSVAAITGLQVTELVRRNDQAALKILTEFASWLGVGIASLVAVLDPELIIVGGGVGELGAVLLDTVRSAVRENLIAGDVRALPLIVGAQLGNHAAVIGAADMARQSIR